MPRSSTRSTVSCSAVAEVTNSEAEQVSVVAHLVNSGRVRLTGNFRGQLV
jgi:hypothetical protein